MKEAEGSSWRPINLRGLPPSPVLRPSLMYRTDGQALLLSGSRHTVFGPSGSGKSWLALYGCLERLRAQEAVIYLDFESSPYRVRERLREMGATDDDLDRFAYVRPVESSYRLSDADRMHLLGFGATLVIFDGVTDAMALDSLEANVGSDTARFYNGLPLQFGDTGAAVVFIDHVARDGRGKEPIGSVHKKGGLDLGYRISCVTPFSRGISGRIAITLAKDRHGYLGYTEGEVVAYLAVNSAPDGSVRLALLPPESAPVTEVERLDQIEYELWTFFRQARAAGITMTSTRIAKGVGRKREDVDKVLAEMVEQGHLIREPQGRALVYRVVDGFDWSAFDT